MELNSYFVDFLGDIRLTPDQKQDLITGHRTLRKRLAEDENLSSVIVSTFLQGSYRRATAIRPKGDKRSDVDIIVVTKLMKEEFPNPQTAMEFFIPFVDKHYKGKYELQGRSIGISLSYVDLDMVITAAPSEAEQGILQLQSIINEDTPDDFENGDDGKKSKSWVSLEEIAMLPNTAKSFKETAQIPQWKLSPLYIPDRDAQTWEPTHPLAQIQWTWKKNQECNRHYVNVVKALKWWRRVNHSTPKYPKGYPVEHLIGQCCPDDIDSVAQGVALTLENISTRYKTSALLKQSPYLPDHGVPEHNVFKRVSGEDFAEFYEQVCKASEIANKALNSNSVHESVALWKQLFGDKFPDAPDESGGDDGSGAKTGGFTPRDKVSNIGGGRFA
jgi:hypothetical protein